MPDLRFICSSKNDVKVYYDPLHSHAATHLEDTPQLKDLVVEVLASTNIEGDNMAFYKDMGRTVGTCDVVEVDASDEIVYGMRKNRTDDGHVPFTKSRPGDACPYVSIHLVKQADGSYLLSSTWIGTFGDDDEPFPNSPLATERSAAFWDQRAFVWAARKSKKEHYVVTSPGNTELWLPEMLIPEREVAGCAKNLARIAHAGTFYHGTRLDMFEAHVQPLIDRTSELGGDDTDAAIITLHDAVEDTDLTIPELSSYGFPYIVVSNVDLLSRRPGQPYAQYLRRMLPSMRASKGKFEDSSLNLFMTLELTKAMPADEHLACLTQYTGNIMFLGARLAADPQLSADWQANVATTIDWAQAIRDDYQLGVDAPPALRPA